MISIRTENDTVQVFALDRQQRSNPDPFSIPLPNYSILSVSCPSYKRISGWASRCEDGVSSATINATSPVMIVFQSFGGQPLINSFGAWYLHWLYIPPVFTSTSSTTSLVATIIPSREFSGMSRGFTGELPISWFIFILFPVVLLCIVVLGIGVLVGLRRRGIVIIGIRFEQPVAVSMLRPEAPLEAPVDTLSVLNAMPGCRPRIIGCPEVPEGGTSSEFLAQFSEQQQKQRALAQEEGEAHSDLFGVCSVCLTDFCRGDVFRQLPCGHDFHKTCIDTWLGRKGYCPICRRSVLGPASTDNNNNNSMAAEADIFLMSMNSNNNDNNNQLADLSPSDLLRLRRAQQAQRELDAGLPYSGLPNSPSSEHAGGQRVLAI